MTNQDKPGVDWTAKHNAAGSNARPTTDRPHNGWQTTAHPVSESDVTTNPNVNVIDRD